MSPTLYCGALHIIDVDLGLLVDQLVAIVNLCLLYIGRIYSHFIHHSMLSFLVYSVHCVMRFHPSKRIDIYLCYSLLRCGLLSDCLFLLFLCYFWDLVAYHLVSEIFPRGWILQNKSCVTFATTFFLQDPSASNTFRWKDDLLWYKDHLYIGKNSELKQKVLFEFHSSPIGGHSCFLKTYHRVKKGFLGWS